MSRLPIRTKLLLLTMGTALAALLVTAVLLTFAERFRLSRQLDQDHRAVAQVVADNVTAALSFADVEDASEVLQALRAKAHVVAGCLYHRDGVLFARYGATDSRRGCPPRVPPPDAEAPAGLRQLVLPVILDGRVIGNVLVRSDLEELANRLQMQMLALLAAVSVAGLAALLLSLRLQRHISHPLAELVRTADSISRDHDFARRAQRQSDDELGDLVAAFNHMLEEIETRDDALQRANLDLRREVEVRQRAEQEKGELLLRERDARQQAEAASRLKDEFLATLSHELRTPLNAILGWAGVLRSRGKPQPEMVERASEVIERNARLQADLVADLLDVSRIITGKMHLEPESVDVAAAITEATETVRPGAEAKGLRLDVDLEADLPRLNLDPARFQQVLWNLLSNAVRFSRAGGRVGIRARRAPGELEILVRDEGIGISPEFLPYVFDRFRQQDASTTRTHGGLGLGLAIVRHLVEAHGGSVGVESPGLDRGAAFSVLLPIPSDSIAAPEPTRSQHEEATLEGLKVLVVEDQADTRELAAVVLRAEGAEVYATATVSEAKESFSATPPDVVLCDIGLPDEDGYAFLEWVRGLPAAHGGTVPAAAITAYASGADAARAASAGFTLHLAKPLPPAKLVEAVRELRALRHDAGRTAGTPLG